MDGPRIVNRTTHGLRLRPAADGTLEIICGHTLLAEALGTAVAKIEPRELPVLVVERKGNSRGDLN